MKIWHFIIIPLLIAVPSGAIWFYHESNRVDNQLSLFGDIKAEKTTTPVPPIFWEDPIIIEAEQPAPSIADKLLPDDALDKIKQDIFSDILEPPSEEEPIVLPDEPLPENDPE